ncbi:fungal hydrophobin [Trametes sanguinea]|nr:fungal hydrophobin [Trametes sanguinea]
MLPRLAVIAALALPALVAAQNCNTGVMQCCNSVKTATDPTVAAIIPLDLIGVVLGDVNALVGIDCSPIEVVGVGAGNSCNAHPVCCENNSLGSAVSIGCVPVTV